MRLGPMNFALLLVALGCKSTDSGPTSRAKGGPGANNQGTELTSDTPEAEGDAPGDTGKLAAGRAAPDVELALQNGKKLKLSELRGKHLVLYFYPKDDTPGCTVEAQGFRDQHQVFIDSGARVLGVSAQGAESHKTFINEQNLPFDLVIDSSGSVAKAFGVPRRLGLTARQTFLIDKDGKLVRIWRDVTPQGHAEEVLAAVRSLEN